MLRSAKFLLILAVLLGTTSAGCQPVNTADMGITMRVNDHTTENITAGQTITFKIRAFRSLSPQGPQTNAVISVTDHLPVGLLFISGSGPGVECTAEGQDITCLTFAGLYAGFGKDITLEVSVDPRLASGIITNTVNILYGGDNHLEDNSSTVTLNVKAPIFATQTLDFNKAKNAGAQFPVRILKKDSNCHLLGVGDWLDPNWDGALQYLPTSSDETIWSKTGGRHAGAEIIVECYGDSEGEAFIGAFASFKLRNGWQVKSFYQDGYTFGHVDFDFDVTPQPGNCNPAIQTHIHTYGTTIEPGSLYLTESWVVRGLEVTIEGPTDTDPYSGSPSIFCEE